MSKSDCPPKIAALIKLSNAMLAMDKAEPKDRPFWRQAYLNVHRSLNAGPNLAQAAKLLKDAVQTRIMFNRYQADPTANEIIRVLQWRLIDHTFIPWPQDEFDRITSLINFEGFTSERLKLCEVCTRIFWAKRITTEYCERQQCLETYKKRRYREKRRSK